VAVVSLKLTCKRTNVSSDEDLTLVHGLHLVILAAVYPVRVLLLLALFTETNYAFVREQKTVIIWGEASQ